MNQQRIGRFVRITKKAAARRYAAGEVIRLTACNMSPVSPWGCYADAQRGEYTAVSGGGFNTTVARNKEWETVVNAFSYYNCSTETGRYPAYWITA